MCNRILKKDLIFIISININFECDYITFFLHKHIRTIMNSITIGIHSVSWRLIQLYANLKLLWRTMATGWHIYMTIYNCNICYKKVYWLTAHQHR